MRRTLLLFLVPLLAIAMYAQDPFAIYGYKTKVATFSGGHYDEFHDKARIVEISSVKLDTKTEKIVGFVKENEKTEELKPQTVSRFLSIDPLAEKYPWLSPYAYCANNPIKFIDPDGKDIIISGALNQEAFKQLQNATGSNITLTMNKDGSICYAKSTSENLDFRAQAIADIIDNNSVIVNLQTTNSNFTSTGNLFIGGAFMGNSIHQAQNNEIIVFANQEINPNVLDAADKQFGTPGKMTLHEVTEAYQGGVISQKAGVSSPKSGQAGSVYQQAHNAAISQNPVYQTMYDAKGNVTNNINQAVRVEWTVYDIKNNPKVIQTLP